MRPFVRVQHIEHGDGNAVRGTFKPLNPRFTFRSNGPGDISYSLALTDPLVTRDGFAPKRTDFRLQVSATGASWRNIMGGFHWPVALENDTGQVNIQGVDWMAYLEQPYWFDAYLIDAGDLSEGTREGIDAILNDAEAWGKAWVGVAGTDTAAVTYNATQQVIVQELVENVANGDDGTLAISTVFSGDLSGWGEPTNYTIMFQDSTNVLDHIRAIGNMDAPFGFDFFMNWDKSLVLYNPARVSPIAAINPIYSITRATKALVKVQWQNDGPMATHTVGVGPGSPGIWAQKTFAPSVDTYRRWLRLVQLGGSYRLPEQVRYATDGIPDRFPQKNLKLTLKPDELVPTDPIAFFSPMIGEALYVDIDFPPYHRINANFWIIAQEFYTDAPGNWLCDVSLQQIYDPSGIG